MSTNLTKFFYNNEEISFEIGDGRIMVNATEMAKPFKKRPSDYLKIQPAKEFLNALKDSQNDYNRFELVTIIQGGKNAGTWMHEDVALDFAQWLSPHFKVWCNQKLKELLTKGNTPTIPLFVRRFHENHDRVESGYFSVIGELFIRVYGKLEFAGHIMPDKAIDGKEIRPDVSVGKTFPKWLDDNYPWQRKEYTMYKHKLPDGTEIDARQYKNIVLPQFIEFIESCWLPERAAKYFKDKDPKALEFLPKLLPPVKKAS